MSELILAICGAGGLGREVLELAKIINAQQNRWQKFVFIDPANGRIENGVPVLSESEAKEKYGNMMDVAIGLGEPKLREKLYSKITGQGYRVVSLIHPNVYIPDTTVIGKGVIIQKGCFISCNMEIKDNVYIQPNCNIGHDVILKTGCIISGMVNIGGRVVIGEYCYLGMGAVVRETTHIGDDSIVSMGAVVMNDVPDRVIVMGNPARVIQRNTKNEILKH